MTTPVTPVADAALPLPDPADLGTWGARMAEMHRWMREDLRTGMNALADDTYTNALAAAAAANFKGPWAGLTGTLLFPATVTHASKVWLLLSDLIDVTTETPGVSAAWMDITTIKAADVVPMVGGAAGLPEWTTAGRPATPGNGHTGFNTDIKKLETWSAALSVWLSAGSRVSKSAVVSLSGSGVDISGVPDWGERNRLIFAGASQNTGDQILVQLGTAAGFVTTGYSSTGVGSAASVGVATSTAGFVVYVAAAARAFSGEMVFHKHGANKWVCTYGGQLVGLSASGGGEVTIADPITSIRVTRPGAATYDGGTVQMICEEIA